MLPILQVGPLALPTPALILLIGFWIGLELTEKQAHRFGVRASEIYNLTLVGLVSGLVGGRLVYAAQSPAAFLAAPLSLLAPRPEMFNVPGGVITALLTGLLYGRLRRMTFWPTLDALTSLFAALAVTLGLAHFASGSAFGAPTNAPWGIELWGAKRQPSQVYETLAALLAAGAVWPGFRAARYSESHAGFRFWLFLALSAAARLILETFRGDSLVVLNLFRAAQLIAWIVLALSLWQIRRRYVIPALRRPGPDAARG